MAVSKDAVLLAERYLGGEYQILPNGVELDRFDSSQRVIKKTDARRSIFFCGRHEPRKGLEVLLQAHATLPEDVDLWIASDGPETERLQRVWAGDPRLMWLGRISDDEKVRRLHEADIFCAPSLGGESFGVVLIEAMAAHTPIVASALDGYMNVATHEVDALLVDPNEPRRLEAALQRLLSDDDLCERLVDAGHHRSRQFSMVHLAESYLTIYRQIIAQAGSTLSASHKFRRAPRLLFRGALDLIRRQ